MRPVAPRDCPQTIGIMVNNAVNDFAACDAVEVLANVRNEGVNFGPTGHEDHDTLGEPLCPQVVELAK
jgi:hypothetical protein